MKNKEFLLIKDLFILVLKSVIKKREPYIIINYSEKVRKFNIIYIKETIVYLIIYRIYNIYLSLNLDK